jgi:hypothetical protein
MSVEQSVEWFASETEVIGKILSQSHSVHHKSHMTWPGLESRSRLWEAGDCLSCGTTLIGVMLRLRTSGKCRRILWKIVTNISEEQSAPITNILWPSNGNHPPNCTASQPSSTRTSDLASATRVQVMPECEELMAESECWWRNGFFNCCDVFELQRTEYGFCYSFNSEVSEVSTGWDYVDIVVSHVPPDTPCLNNLTFLLRLTHVCMFQCGRLLRSDWNRRFSGLSSKVVW